MGEGKKRNCIYPYRRGALFGRIVRGSVIGECRRPGVDQASSGIEADKIGARRLRQRDDQAVGSRGHENKDRYLDREQDAAAETGAFPVQQTAHGNDR